MYTTVLKTAQLPGKVGTQLSGLLSRCHWPCVGSGLTAGTALLYENFGHCFHILSPNPAATGEPCTGS